MIMSLKGIHKLASGREVSVAQGNFNEYPHQYVSESVLFSTNLLKVSKYIQIEKSSINYKQKFLSLMLFSQELYDH